MQKCSICDTKMARPKGVKINSVTPNVCPACLASFELRSVADVCIFLENLPAPILVVDADNAIKGANTLACKAISKDLPHILRLRGGDVFECAHALLPGGCGKTTHCSGCTIRRAILETLATGQSLSKIPVEVLQRVDGKDKRVPLTISTQRMTNCVLLQIDGGL